MTQTPELILFYLYNITSETWYGGEDRRLPKIWTAFEDACWLDIAINSEKFYDHLADVVHLIDFNGTDKLILVRVNYDKEGDTSSADFQWVIPIDNAELIFKLVELYGWGDHEWQAIGSV